MGVGAGGKGSGGESAVGMSGRAGKIRGKNKNDRSTGWRRTGGGKKNRSDVGEGGKRVARGGERR